MGSTLSIYPIMLSFAQLCLAVLSCTQSCLHGAQMLPSLNDRTQDLLKPLLYPNFGTPGTNGNIS